jgi:hypothetical protein
MRIFALEESTQNIVRFGDKVQFVSIIYLKILDEGIMGCDDDIFVLHVFHLNSEFLSGMGCHTRSRHTRLLFAPSSWSTSYHEEIKTDNKQLILKLVLHQFTRESDGSTTTTSRSSRQSPLRQASNNLFVPASAHLFIPVVVSKSTNQCQFQYVLCVKEEEHRDRPGHAAAGVRGLSATARPNKSSRCKISRRSTRKRKMDILVDRQLVICPSETAHSLCPS